MNWTDKSDGEKLYAAEVNAIAAAAANAETNASTALNRANAAQAAMQALTEYSTTPQQIGTWIDGTPIWRIAFKAELTESIKSDKAFFLFYDMTVVRDTDEISLVIGGFASIDNGAITDNNPTTFDARGFFNWDELNPDAEYISGYIEFVTPASNIIN